MEGIFLQSYLFASTITIVLVVVEVLAPGVEGGEIVTEGMLDKYDARKIIQYPGFNVPPSPDSYDVSIIKNRMLIKSNTKIVE